MIIMKEELVILFLCWGIPTVISSAGLIFSESIGYTLRGCSLTITQWLRYVLVQQALMSFLITSLYFMPRKYSVYFDRFLNHGHVSFALVIWFFFMQVITPICSLVIYLPFSKTCGGQISKYMAIYYWIMIGVQALIAIPSGILLIVLLGVFANELETNRVLQIAQKCGKQATKMIESVRNPTVLYQELLQRNPTWKAFLSSVDILYFKEHLCFNLDETDANLLATSQQFCSICLSIPEPRQKILFVESCAHFFHWECFRASFWGKQVCPFCDKPLLAQMKDSVGRPVDMHKVREAMQVAPCKKPENLVLDQILRLRRPRRILAQPIVTIEYFNYTFDQKAGPRPTETPPVPVADTEI